MELDRGVLESRIPFRTLVNRGPSLCEVPERLSISHAFLRSCIITPL